MNGGQIDHIEAHFGDVGQELFAIGEGAVDAGLGGGRTREEFIPGAEARANRIDNNGELAIGFGGEALVGVAESDLVEGGIGGMDAQRLGFLTGAQNGGTLLEPQGIRAGGTGGSLRDEIGADEIVDRRIGFGMDALQQIATPGLKMIDPALDLEGVSTQLGDAECAEPSIVDEGLHGNLDPVGGALAPGKQGGGDGVVAIGEDVGLNADLIAYGSLCREASAVDFGGDAFDDDASATIGWSDCHGSAVFSRVRLR